MNLIKGPWGRCVLVCALLLTLSGCKDADAEPPQPTQTFATRLPPDSFPCSVFDYSRWQDFRFGVDSPADVVTALARSPDRNRAQILRNQLPRHDLEVVDWDGIGVESEIAYTAWFRNEKGLFLIRGYLRMRPTLAQTMDCLGAPEYYEATYFFGLDLQLNLKLWYPEQGIVIEHVSFHSQELPPAIDADYRIPFFSVLAPGEPEDMVGNLYVQGEDPDVQAYGLCVLRPWPGSIEALKVESFLDEQRCGPDTIEPANLGIRQPDDLQRGS